MKNQLEINSNKCVNSNWKARFLSQENEEYCQCSFGECKVRVSIAHNGHKPHEYILTEKEIEQAQAILDKEEGEEIPQMKGTREALGNLTINKNL